MVNKKNYAKPFGYCNTCKCEHSKYWELDENQSCYYMQIIYLVFRFEFEPFKNPPNLDRKSCMFCGNPGKIALAMSRDPPYLKIIKKIGGIRFHERCLFKKLQSMNTRNLSNCCVCKHGKPVTVCVKCNRIMHSSKCRSCGKTCSRIIEGGKICAYCDPENEEFVNDNGDNNDNGNNNDTDNSDDGDDNGDDNDNDNDNDNGDEASTSASTSTSILSDSKLTSSTPINTRNTNRARTRGTRSAVRFNDSTINDSGIGLDTPITKKK